MTRERLVFDVCAAPFGTNYFFSCRFGEVPVVVQAWEILALLFALGLGGIVSFFACIKVFGLLAPFIWPFGCLGFILLAVYTMRNSIAMGLQDLDATLLKIPSVQFRV